MSFPKPRHEIGAVEILMKIYLKFGSISITNEKIIVNHHSILRFNNFCWQTASRSFVEAKVHPAMNALHHEK